MFWNALGASFAAGVKGCSCCLQRSGRKKELSFLWHTWVGAVSEQRFLFPPQLVFFWGQLPLPSIRHHSKTSSLAQFGYFAGQNSELTAFLKSRVLPDDPVCVASAEVSCSPLSSLCHLHHLVCQSNITGPVFAQMCCECVAPWLQKGGPVTAQLRLSVLFWLEKYSMPKALPTWKPSAFINIT